MLLTNAILCLAMNIYHEARGEPLLGQIAVAQVTMNRAKGERARICDEVLKRKQFSWTTKLVTPDARVAASGAPKERGAWLIAKTIAIITLLGGLSAHDVTGGGATHYHASRVSPYWARSMSTTATIGAHIFYR